MWEAQVREGDRKDTRQKDRQDRQTDLSSHPLSCSYVEDEGRVTISGWQLVQTFQILGESMKRRI